MVDHGNQNALYDEIQSLKRKNAELNRRLDEYKQRFHETADAIVIIDNTGQILECNRTMIDVYGYQQEELIGSHVLMLHHERDDLDYVSQNIKSVEGRVSPHEYLHKKKDGTPMPVEVCTSLIHYNGKTAQFATIRDITERKSAYDKLIESEKRFRLAFDYSFIGKSLAFMNGPFFWVNRKLCSILGYSADELIGMRASEITHPDDLDLSMQMIKDQYNGKIENDAFTLEKRYIHKKGHTVWCNTTVALVKDEEDKPLYTIIEMVDITIRKNTEKLNQKLRKYLSNIINSMPSVLVGVNSEGKVTQWNKKAETETGYCEKEALDQDISQLFPYLKGELYYVKTAIKRRKTWKSSKIARQSGDGMVYEDITIYPLVTNGNDGAVIRIDDVTEQVRLEEMMIQSEKMMSVGGLAAGMAHEINNPLAGIMQNTQVVISRLTRDLPVNIKAARDAGTSFNSVKEFMEKRGVIRQLKMVHSTAGRADQIVQNMLSFARKSSPVKQPCNIASLIDKTIDLARSDYNIRKNYDFKSFRITRCYSEKIPDIPCEETKIQQVLLNLIKNSAEAMFEDKYVPPSEPELIFKTILSNNHVVIHIQDNGPGIPREIRKQIFEPFYTTKKPGKGTGLGLSVSYFIIVHDHQGEMNVESAPEQGTVFTIKLPIHRDEMLL